MTPMASTRPSQATQSRAATARASGDPRLGRPNRTRSAQADADGGSRVAAATLVPTPPAAAATAQRAAAETAPTHLWAAVPPPRRSALAATMVALWRQVTAFVRAYGPGACRAGAGASLIGVMLRPLAVVLPGLAATAGVAPILAAPLLGTVVTLAALGVAVYVALAWGWPAALRRACAEADRLHAEVDRRTRAMSPVARGAAYGAAAGYVVAASLCTVPGAIGWGVVAGVAVGGIAVGGLLQFELACRRLWTRMCGGDPTSLRPLDADLAPGARLALLVGLGATLLAAASIGLGIQI